MFFCVFANAQIRVAASVNETVMEVGEEYYLTITVTGPPNDTFAPALPSMPNFNVYYGGLNIASAVDESGSYVPELHYNYRIIPRFPGKAEIGPVKIEYLGKEYTSEPININVYRTGEAAGKEPPKQAETKKAASSRPVVPRVSGQEKSAPDIPKQQSYDDVFLLAKTDKKEAYVGEQITLTTTFYSSYSLEGSSLYYAPAIEGFTKEEMDGDVGKTMLAGQEYLYNTVETALFGVSPGIGTVGPSRVEYTASKSRGMPKLDSLLGRILEPGSVKSVPLEIGIKPLPMQGRDKTFTGAVGEKYSITASLDRDNIEVGEAATLTLTVRGVGNLKMVSPPLIPEIEGFKSYEAAGNSNVAPVKGVVQGMKTFKTVLVATAPGEFTVPSIAFSFFSPTNEKYVKVNSEPLKIKVIPSTGGVDNVISYGGAAQGPSAKAYLTDINYIKQNAWVNKFNLLLFFNDLGRFNLIPVLIGAIILFIKMLSKSGLLDNPVIKAKAAVKGANDVETLSLAVTRFVKDKTGFSMGSMTTKNLVAALSSKYNVSALTLQTLEDVLNQLNAFRFAPAGTVNALEFDNVKQKTLQVLKNLEREIK